MDNYFKSKKFKEILANYKDFVNNDSSVILGAEEFADVAQYFHDKNNDEEALKAIDTALDLYPGSVAPLAFKSRYALLEEHDSQKADDIAEEIDDHNDPDYILLKAEIMIADARIDEADEYLENAYEQFYDDDYYDDMPLDVATLFADYEEAGYASKWLERSDEKDEPDYDYTKARILMYNGQFDESIEILNKLVNDEPYQSSYWNMLASAQLLAGKLSDSVTSSEYALAIDPEDQEALLNKANGLMGLENYKEAEKLFRQYTELSPKADNGYLMVALTIMAQDRYQEAVQWFAKALEVNSNVPNQPWQDRAEILFQMAMLENYLEHFDKVHEYLDKLADVYKDNLSYDMDEMGNRLAEVDCAHGHTYLEEEKIDEAAEWFDQAVTDSNADPRIYVKIAASAYECGYVQYAYGILHELIYENGVEDSLGLKYLAYCCRALGKDGELKWAEEKTKKNITSKEK